MLKKKIDRARDWMDTKKEVFRCPICHSENMQIEGHSLVCLQHHRFDLSKKGTLYFLKKNKVTEYNQEMFVARQRMIHRGMYDEVLQQLALLMHLEPHQVLLDAGCGEGSFLARLSEWGVPGYKVGFDLSKEGIQLAANHNETIFWCVADMTNLPFATAQTDIILNYLSPAHYGEFKRVLKPEGLVVKVIPEANYLQELRKLFYQDNQEKQQYSNQKVYQKFQNEWNLLESKRVTYSFPIESEHRADLLRMSPLQWSATDIETMDKRVLSSITVDLRILVGQKI